MDFGGKEALLVLYLLPVKTYLPSFDGIDYQLTIKPRKKL